MLLHEGANLELPLVKQGLDISAHISEGVESGRSYRSLAKVLKFLLFAVLALILTISSLVYYRLFQVRNILADIAGESVPSMVHSTKNFTQASELNSVLDGLIQASSDASRRIASLQIQRELDKALALNDKLPEDSFFMLQLAAIVEELETLDVLIERRLDIARRIDDLKEGMFKLHAELIVYADNPVSTKEGNSDRVWALQFSEIVALASKALNQTRLQPLRELSLQLSQKMQIQTELVAGLSPSLRPRAAKLNAQLQHLLTDKQGMIALRIEQLRINGRAIGRGNFIRNLIKDYTRVTESEFFRQTDNLMNDTRLSARQLSEQSLILGLFLLLAMLCLALVLVYIQKKVIRRLSNLNRNIRERTSGSKESIAVGGEDEITEIADSFSYFVGEIERQKRQLELISRTDSLTKIPNRRAVDERLLKELQRGKRHSWPVSLLIVDVDYFKCYNDNLGHSAGDDCLVSVATVLTRALRRSEDFVGRYGGEEFVCILSDTDSKGASQIAKSILDAFVRARIPHPYSEVAEYVTVSIGIAIYMPGTEPDADTLLNRADLALYTAKGRGRNCYVYQGTAN